MRVRADRYLGNLWIASRKELVKVIKDIWIKINGKETFKSDIKVVDWDIIEFNWEKIEVKEDVLILLHKPAWYVSSDIAEWDHPSYKELLKDCPYRNLVKVAWRLDVDTEWLLVLSSSGSLIHQIISPKKWKEKIYLVKLRDKITEEAIKKLEEWVDIWDYITLPAKVKKIDNKQIYLTITEGKFHQIKKMANSVGNQVEYLKRIKVGEYELWNLKLGKWKYVN